MKKELLEQAAEYQKKHKRVKRWQRLVTLLVAIVVFVTTYALILPAITRESQPTCGFDEHQHNDDCYQTVAQRIVCDVKVHTTLTNVMIKQALAFVVIMIALFTVITIFAMMLFAV